MSPLGYYFYLRGSVDGLIPAPSRRSGTPAAIAASRRQSLGLMLISATICVPVLAAGAIVAALKLPS